MARFEYKFDGENLHDWERGGDAQVILPDPHAPLKAQRAMVRALNTVFPQTEIKLLSHTDLEDGSVVTRTVKMDIKHPRRDNGQED